MSNSIGSIDEILAELKSRGYNAKNEGKLIEIEFNPECGVCRNYTVESDANGWHLNLSIVTFSENGEDEEEQITLGSFASASEIADAIDEEEGSA